MICKIQKKYSTFVRVFFMVLDLRFVEAVVRHLPLFISCAWLERTCNGSHKILFPSPYYLIYCE